MINLDEATHDWLDEYLKSQFGGLASHVVRTEDNARTYYISHALGLSLYQYDGVKTGTPGYIMVRTQQDLSAEALTALVAAEIQFGGRTHRFDALGADKDWDGGTYAGAFVELTYRATDA